MKQVSILTVLVLSACAKGSEGDDACCETAVGADLVVVATASPGGDIGPQGELRVEPGEVLSFELTAQEGHELVAVEGSCPGILSDAVFLTDPIEEDCTVEALFEELTPEPAAYCSGAPSDIADILVCDPEQSLDNWAEGKSYWTNDLRIPAGSILALPFTSNAQGLSGTLDITNNMPGLHASGLYWHGWFSETPGGDRVEENTYCDLHSPNPNPQQIRWNQTQPEEWMCHLGTTERTLYFNAEVRCFEEYSSTCTPGERYESDYYFGISPRLNE